MRSTILLLALLTACGYERPGTATIEPAEPRPATIGDLGTVGRTPVVETAGSPITTEATEADLARVILRDGRIDAPESLPRGETPLYIENGGSVAHAVAVEGGKTREAIAPLAPGESFVLQVFLDEPAVTLFCPIEGHDERTTIRMRASE